MAYPPPQYGRDPYMQPERTVTNQPSGYYPTYPGPAQQQQQPQKYEKQYDNRGYREEQRYYDAPAPAPGPGPRGGAYKAPAPMLPDSLPAGHRGREWKNGLFSCTNDPKTCMCVWCCGEIYACYRGHEFGESCWNFWPCCFATTLVALRHRMREREGIQGSLMGDCAASTFCGACVLCQLYAENDMVRGGGSGRTDMQPPPMMDRY